VENGGKQKAKRGRRRFEPEQDFPDAKAAILRSARTLFADRGYEGASAADIAAGAGVNKALVFYYFGSKENILKEVLNAAAAEAVDRRAQFLKKENPFSEEVIKEYYDDALREMEAKSEVIRILLTEAIKKSGGGALLFDFLEKAMGDIAVRMDKRGLSAREGEKLRTSEFFFDAMALFAFAALEGKWSVYSGIDRAKVREDFLEVFGNTYLNYLIHRYYSIIK
jgi:AcrR family transcriptional regulator